MPHNILFCGEIRKIFVFSKTNDLSDAMILCCLSVNGIKGREKTSERKEMENWRKMKEKANDSTEIEKNTNMTSSYTCSKYSRSLSSHYHPSKQAPPPPPPPHTPCKKKKKKKKKLPTHYTLEESNFNSIGFRHS